MERGDKGKLNKLSIKEVEVERVFYSGMNSLQLANVTFGVWRLFCYGRALKEILLICM